MTVLHGLISFVFPIVQVFVPPCVSTPEFVHAAMRPDVITETVVEVSTEEPEPMDTSAAVPIPETPEPTKKKKGIFLFVGAVKIVFFKWGNIVLCFLNFHFKNFKEGILACSYIFITSVVSQ